MGPASFLISVGTAFVTACVTWLGIEFLLKPRIRPKLKVEYDPGDQFCKIDYLMKNGSVYHRVRVVNVRYASARFPRVYLINVEIMDGNSPTASDHCDGPLPLSWAYEAAGMDKMPVKPREADLPLLKDTPDYADICMVRGNGQATLGLLVEPYNKYAKLIEKGKVYRLTVQAVAEDAKPCKYSLDIKWDGTGAGLSLEPAPNARARRK